MGNPARHAETGEIELMRGGGDDKCPVHRTLSNEIKIDTRLTPAT